MLNLQKLWALQLAPPFGNNHFAVLHCWYVDSLWLEGYYKMAYSEPKAILSLRCWALFGGSPQILVVLIAVYACCLGLQLVGQSFIPWLLLR